MPDLVNWWIARARLQAVTKAQVKPEAITKYVAQLMAAAQRLEKEIARQHKRHVKSRKTQGLPHVPKLDADMVPMLNLEWADTVKAPSRKVIVTIPKGDSDDPDH